MSLRAEKPWVRVEHGTSRLSERERERKEIRTRVSGEARLGAAPLPDGLKQLRELSHPRKLSRRVMSRDTGWSELTRSSSGSSRGACHQAAQVSQLSPVLHSQEGATKFQLFNMILIDFSCFIFSE